MWCADCPHLNARSARQGRISTRLAPPPLGAQSACNGRSGPFFGGTPAGDATHLLAAAPGAAAIGWFAAGELGPAPFGEAAGADARTTLMGFTSASTLLLAPRARV